MEKPYNHHFQHRSPHLHYKSTFLPVICSRSAIKDVAIPKLEDRSMSFSTDPLSPKIGCMGQVKRNNKIIGFPTSTKLSFTTTNTKSDTISSFNYSKLKKIFSGKNLTSNTTPTTTAVSSFNANNSVKIKVSSCREREAVSSGTSGAKIYVSIEHMDPPLPVIKKQVKKQVEGEDEMGNLWKRRSGGVELKGLQLQQIQVNRQKFAPITV